MPGEPGWCRADSGYAFAMADTEAHPERSRPPGGPTPTRPGDARAEGVELDPDQLSPGALRGLVEEYVTREGTDYGHRDWSLEDKVAQVYRQLECGEARIVFDLESGSASIVTAPELALHTLYAAEETSEADDHVDGA